MNCPFCNAPLVNAYRCQNCNKIDPVMQKIIYASNWHYNQGLAKAMVRDLTGATNSLLTSLKYNKRNTDARNLLGLIYFQTGEIVSALGEWVISMHFKKKDNIASTYIRSIQNNPGRLHQANKIIQKYNLALKYLEQSNSDMAIIELKKVVNMNPNYIRAYQLLGLLYIKSRQYASARKVLVRSLKVDRNNITSLRYLEELSRIIGSKTTGKTKKKDEFSGINDPVPVVIEEKSAGRYTEFSTGWISFVNVIIGIIIGGAVMWLLVVPSVQRSEYSKHNQEIIEYSSQLSDKNREISSLTREVETLTREKNALQNQAELYQSATDEGLNDRLLVQAAREYLLGENNNAGNHVAEIDESLLDSEEAKQLYNKLLDLTKDDVSSSIRNQGISNFEAGNYQDAIADFEKKLRLDSSDTEAMYYIARSYHLLTDLDNAVTYYEQITEGYPESSWATQAAEQLQSIR